MESKQTYLNTYLSFKSSEYRIYQKNIQRLKDEKWTVVSDDFSIDKTIRTIMFKRPL